MLTREQNELLCRVEGGATMGQIMRRHWLPLCMAEEAAARDGAPVRSRLLGEDLVAFRDSQGRLGVLGEHCLHRGASLAFGRNEQCGLRCLYHGWKFDVEGVVVDMPSEAPGAAARLGKKTKSYPVREGGGFLWVWMGPRGEMREFEPPAWAPTRETRISIVKMHAACNWAQVLEGSIDSTLFIAPFTVLIPPNDRYNLAQMLVPIDDVNTMFYWVAWHPDPEKGISQEEWRGFCAATIGVDLDENYRKKRNLENRYLQDREAMARGDWTGIQGIPTQDMAMWESMGPIADRSRDSPGASDLAVAQFRRMMLAAAKKFQEGAPAIGTAEPRIAHVKLASFEGIVPKSTDWRTLGAALEEPVS